MDNVLNALREQQQELTDILRPLTAQEWSQPSACDGWDIADVVVHLIHTNELAIASAEHRFPHNAFRSETAATETAATQASNRTIEGDASAMNIDDLAALAVASADTSDPAQLLTDWELGADRLATALAQCRHADRLQWVAGTLSARTLATTRLAETWIHTGDVAAGFGVKPAATKRLWHIARLAWRTIPYSFQREGLATPAPVAFDLLAPDGDAWQFGLDVDHATVIKGSAEQLCWVASRRVPVSETSLTGDGPDSDQVLALVRTWA